MAITQTLKTYIQSHDRLNAAVMAVYMRTVHPANIKRRAKARGLTAQFSGDIIQVRRGHRAIQLSAGHAIYLQEIVEEFDHYFRAVAPSRVDRLEVVDFSLPRYQDLIGYDLHPVYFPAVAEPLDTIVQYLDFARLGEGDVALDLGAYSGLAAILMRERCGRTGTVVAVEADRDNLRAVKRNLDLYQRLTGKRIELFEGAVWTHEEGITFSNEGNTGSAATDIVGNRLGTARAVPSITLSALARRFALTRVDVIKCDIEGAEAVIFDDPAFFARHRPRIIAEVHPVKGVMTTAAVQATLAPFGYRCAEVAQPGSRFPLIECHPPEGWRVAPAVARPAAAPAELVG